MNRFEPPRIGDADGWFRAGGFEITTTILASALSAVSIVLWVVSKQLFVSPFYLTGPSVQSGQVWRIFTWPFVNKPDLWIVVSIAMLYIIGGQIEQVLGRVKYTWMLGLMVTIPGIVGTIFSMNVPPQWIGVQFVTSGLFVVLVLWQPSARSFFNIPLWVLVVVFEIITVLQIADLGAWPLMWFFLAGLATAALGARAFDLTEFSEIPRIPLPQFIIQDPYQKANRARERSQKSKQKGSGPTSTRPSRRRKQPADVIPIRPEPRLDRQSQADMDRLLDKISADGIDSLTAAERQQLDDLSRRLRGG